MVTIHSVAPSELELVWALVRRTVGHMNETGNAQWGADYPTRSHYAADLRRGELYGAYTLEGRLAGVGVLNTDEAPAYAPLPWSVPGPALVIHRAAVDPCCQRQGAASALFAYAEALARHNALKSLRVDTYAQNKGMLALLAGRGYRQVGLVHFDRENRPLGYPVFEKVL